MIEKHVKLNLVGEAENENIVEYDVEEFDLSNEEEKMKLEALKQVNSATVNMPLELENGWVCLCGQYNAGDGSYCGKCRAEKAVVFDCIKEENLENLVSEYQQKSAEKKIKAEKMKKQGLIIGVAGGIALILLICLITNFCIINSRRTFTSAENMSDALQGTWTCSSLKLKIDGDKGTTLSSGSTSGDSEDIKWHPIRGYFKYAGQKFVVKKDGTLKQSSNEYKKSTSGSPSKSSSSPKSGSSSKSSSSSSSKSSSYESKYTALKVSNVKVTSNSSYTVCTGTVTNTGKQKYTFVKVKGAFKDAKGTVLDTDSTYAIGSEGLSAGESTTFRMSVPKNVSIKTCTVTIMN